MAARAIPDFACQSPLLSLLRNMVLFGFSLYRPLYLKSRLLLSLLMGAHTQEDVGGDDNGKGGGRNGIARPGIVFKDGAKPQVIQQHVGGSPGEYERGNIEQPGQTPDQFGDERATE